MFSRSLLMAAGLALAFAAPANADWPEKPVRIIVPYAPGGSGDNTARAYQDKLSEKFGQQFVIENRGGAAGAIGIEAASKAEGDGYTFLQTPMGGLVILPHLRNVPYDPFEDFKPVSRTAETVAAMAVHPSLGVNTVKEFIALAKEKPGEIFFGSAGQGTITQMRGEVLKDVAGIDIVHVPYRGSGEALNDLLAGHVQVNFEGNVLPHGKAGTLKLLAFISDERHPDFPDVPTMKEAGLENYEAPSWHGMLAPKGTPDDIIKKLSDALIEISQTPEVKKRLIDVGLMARGETPEQMGAVMKQHYDLFGDLIKRLDIKIQ